MQRCCFSSNPANPRRPIWVGNVATLEVATVIAPLFRKVLETQRNSRMIWMLLDFDHEMEAALLHGNATGPGRRKCVAADLCGHGVGIPAHFDALAIELQKFAIVELAEEVVQMGFDRPRVRDVHHDSSWLDASAASATYRRLSEKSSWM